MSRPNPALLMPARLLAIGGALAAVLVGASCAERRDVYLEVEGTPNTFAPEAGVGPDVDAPAPDVPMCPLSTCMPPWTTCPSTEFLCGTNLLTDNDNCGRCGNRCAGVIEATHSNWTCVDGQCLFSCLPLYANCDGDGTNGCETFVETKDNCGACGVKCGPWEECLDMQCYNSCKLKGFPDRCGDRCTNLLGDDEHCGTCGTRCPPDDSSKPLLPAGMYYGCGSGECGHPKCSDPATANCNGDIADGCETALHTNEHCSACDDKCSDGQSCVNYGGKWSCLCPPGETLCDGNLCFRTDDNIAHCGGCGRRCPGFRTPHFEVMCTKGTCGGKCEDGYADCDELLDNGCEVDTRIDNRHCGACGQACLPGQVCFQGTCQVGPCDAGPVGAQAK